MRFDPFLLLCNSEDHIYNVIYRLRKTTGMFIHNAQPVHRIVQAKDCSEPQRLSTVYLQLFAVILQSPSASRVAANHPPMDPRARDREDLIATLNSAVVCGSDGFDDTNTSVLPFLV
jgi:hypothetical protein